MRLRAPAAALALVLVGAGGEARAFDPFEIQVYDGTANKPGAFGLELHLNRFATGWVNAIPPELPLRGQFHLTLEPSFGIFPWWEMGAYLQTTLRADRHYDFAGVKLRSKFVALSTFHPHLRLGLNLELSYLPAAYDRDQWGMELRPIVGWADEHWLFVANPIMDLGLAGQSLRNGPTFEPAAKIARSFAELLAVGVEYYGALGPIARPLPIGEQIHEIFAVIDLEALPAVELELGLGGGVTTASAGLVGKVIVGTSFDVMNASRRR
jgi:hypothetical protein